MRFLSVLYWLFSHNLDVYKCQFLTSFINICISKCYQILKVSPLLQLNKKEWRDPNRRVRSSAGIDLPQRSFEALYSNVFRGTTKGELVSTVWPPAPPKVTQSRFVSTTIGHLRVFFFTKKFSCPKGKSKPKACWHLLKIVILRVHLRYFGTLY